MSRKGLLIEYLTYRAIPICMVNFPIRTCININCKFKALNSHSQKMTSTTNEQTNDSKNVGEF